MLSQDRHNCFRCIPVQLTKIIDMEEILASLHETNFQRIIYSSKNKLKTPKKLHRIKTASNQLQILKVLVELIR